MKTIDMLYKALEKSAYEEYDDRYANTGVDAKSDETAVEKERKRKKRDSGFFSPTAAAVLAGLAGVGIGGAAAAKTDKGRGFYKKLYSKIKKIKGQAEDEVAKPVNWLRKLLAPDSSIGDWAWLPGAVGAGTGIPLMLRAWGPLGPISDTSAVVGHLNEVKGNMMSEYNKSVEDWLSNFGKAKKHLENIQADPNAPVSDLRNARDNYESIWKQRPERTVDTGVIDKAIADLETPKKRRGLAYTLFGNRGVRVKNRHILDNPELQKLLSQYHDKGGDAVLAKSRFRGYMGKAPRRLTGLAGGLLTGGGLAWSAVNATRNYEKMKGRAH